VTHKRLILCFKFILKKSIYELQTSDFTVIFRRGLLQNLQTLKILKKKLPNVPIIIKYYHTISKVTVIKITSYLVQSKMIFFAKYTNYENGKGLNNFHRFKTLKSLKDKNNQALSLI
jgi:hypothetical protein